MSFLHRHKLVELITDPSSGRLSMSRFLLPWVILLVGAWAYAAATGRVVKEALVPISSMIGIVGGAICGIYGLSTFGGSISSAVAQWTGTAAPLTPPKAKPAPPEQGG